MNEIEERLAALSSAQRELLKLRVQKDLQPSAPNDVSVPLPTSAETNLPSLQVGHSSASPQKIESPKTMQFSLYSFADGGTKTTEKKYRLLLESAKFADRQGFSAIWTPERHFHDFGGFYPNPSVLSAALAVVTERIQIRAGSVALPLHNPIRVAEEWAIVDNLSQGRIGISFASGWHPLDFVLFPEKYQQRREIMFRDIEIVRRLWAGEALKFPSVDGCEVEVKTLPRPIQAQLPVWITTSSSLETWIRAGEIGANIFAALVSYSFEELARRISMYRQSLVEHGHDPQASKVTLMLHTFVGDDENAIKEKVRPHLTNYLCSHMQQFPHAPLQSTPIEREDMEALASIAFENYFATSALLGTPQKCSHLLERLLAIGVDEAACLIDFGLDMDAVMEGLHQLTQLKNSFTQQRLPATSAHVSEPVGAR